MNNFIKEFKKLQKEIHSNAKKKGWYEEDRNKAELLCLVHSEISEALEHLRNGNRKDDKLQDRLGVEAELADAVIRIMGMAEYCGYNLAETIIEKIEFNKSREYRHGKEF